MPQYRKITNNLCNRYISNYVREEYEQEPIYTEENHNSYRDYCWDIYDTVPISIIEAILDNFKQQEDNEKEKINSKQALNEIRKICNDWIYGNEDFCIKSNENILQIIDKILGDEK